MPTEAEWEYACRAGSTFRSYFGEDEGRLKNCAWYKGNADDAGRHCVQEVGKKTANTFGLHDMSGNVYEWCQDWYGSDYYGRSPSVDPKGPGSGGDRLLRGGSWNDPRWSCRSADRAWLKPARTRNNIGFRVVVELPPTAKPVPPAADAPKKGVALPTGWSQ